MDFETKKYISRAKKIRIPVEVLLFVRSMFENRGIAEKKQLALLAKSYLNASEYYSRYRSAVLKHFRKKRYWSRKKAKRFHQMRVGG